MIDDGDAQAAVDYAAAGVAIDGLGLAPARAAKMNSLKPTSEAEPTQVDGQAEAIGQQVTAEPAPTPDDARPAELPAEGPGEGPGEGQTAAGPTNEELAAGDYAALADRKVDIKVLIEDTGKLAKLTMKAGDLLRDLDARIRTLQTTGTPAAEDLAELKDRAEILKALAWSQAMPSDRSFRLAGQPAV